MLKKYVLLGWLLGIMQVNAGEIGVVDNVEAPAWLQRGNLTKPLVSGLQLQNNDRILTGSQARVSLKLAEGSTVKLGQNATFALQDVDAGIDKDNVYRGILNVVKGAFRFTTSVLSKSSNHREINVKLGTITAGIRGTDIWGIVDDQEDLVALLEGTIEVTHTSGATEVIAEPLSVYAANINQLPSPLSHLTQPTVNALAKETDLIENAGATNPDGIWHVNLGAYNSRQAAERAGSMYREQGYDIQTREFTYNHHKRYQLHLDHFVSKAEARGATDLLTQKYGLEVARVTKN
ncbi:FecR domain-containing protein [Methyloradius palustris]|uniref:SPOR domain-containing protein n=1 Tax=Methyloradius palustris TaxID=2778876 RepID=A0A8D5FYY1_9PROT|nr:FecR domain-containing protein [Methyloradius palustris]BCM24305.1 hypothetical protein ZMTM_05640 [Methyloradius palustris]